MNNEDAISRTELLEIAEQQGHVTVDDIINAEAVLPQVAHGRWVPDGKEHVHCSNCGDGRNIRTQIAWEFCPNCGAWMGGGDDAAD